MVYHNTVKYPIPDPRYADESWRAQHHFKEEHQHDSPYRRSRDFKPVPWGAARGMPNYRHAEPWLNMKNLFTFTEERHHHPTKWIKRFLFGAGVGLVMGQLWFFLAPINGFAAQKLFATIGERQWSGRLYRMLKETAPRHMMTGGSIFLSYDILMEFMRHHDETNLRPKLVDHLIAMSIIGTFGGWIATNSIRGAFQGFLFFGLNLGFLSYWAMQMGTRPGAGLTSTNIQYEADVTQEEKERFEMLDQVNILAFNMQTKPGYGFMHQPTRFQQ